MQLKSPIIFLFVALLGCTSVPEAANGRRNQVTQEVYSRWRDDNNYYALLEIVDAHIRVGVSRESVLEHLGVPTANSPDEYIGAGPNSWVYIGYDRHVPRGHYLYLGFDAEGLVCQLGWGSE